MVNCKKCVSYERCHELGYDFANSAEPNHTCRHFNFRIMDKKDKVKSIYKSILMTLFCLNNRSPFDGIICSETQKVLKKLPTLFPEINFDDLKNEIVNEFLNQDMSSKEDAEEILGYRYGNSPEIHDDLPDHNEEIVVVYKDGSTRGYDYIDGNLIRPRC